jgi:hypothetical protein
VISLTKILAEKPTSTSSHELSDDSQIFALSIQDVAIQGDTLCAQSPSLSGVALPALLPCVCQEQGNSATTDPAHNEPHQAALSSHS